jgi:large subunit ribosomal protein L9
VPGLGIVGDEVRVADGYARNYLLPKKLAGPVSAVAKSRLVEKRAKREVELTHELEHAGKVATRLNQAELKVEVRTSSEGRLYGSVNTTDVLQAAKAKGFELKREMIMIDHPMRELGEYSVGVRLHPEVTAQLKVIVSEQPEE